jgi:hypothetical protein
MTKAPNSKGIEKVTVSSKKWQKRLDIHFPPGCRPIPTVSIHQDEEFTIRFIDDRTGDMYDMCKLSVVSDS